MPTITALPPTNKLDQLSVKLSGITSDKKSGKKAWLIIPAPPNKNTNPQYLSIPEHEKQGDIEVVEINEKENTVKILLAGAPMELNFKDNGLPTPAAPLVPGIGYTPHGLPAPLAPTFALELPGQQLAAHDIKLIEPGHEGRVEQQIWSCSFWC